MNMDSPSKYTLAELEAILKKERPHLILIDNEVQKVDNGIVSVDIRIHQGRVTDIALKQVTRIVLN